MTTMSVSDIQEYLLLKGVEAVAIHGSKSTPFKVLIDNPISNYP